jgi:hypothetical protein
MLTLTVVIFCGALLAATASASAAPPVPPGGFRLPASNGYSLTVASFHKPDTERGEVLVLVQARSSAVLYFARATVTEPR